MSTSATIAKVLSLSLLISLAGFMSGCVNQSVKHVNATRAVHAEKEIPQAELLDVNIAVFDPGYTEPVEEDSGIFPQVRKAESGFIPYRLRETLQSTGHWGPVRVVPSPNTSSELMITGKIIESNGRDLELAVKAVDASGRVWLDKTYDETAASLSYSDSDPSNIDPFQDLYNRIANDLLKSRKDLSSKQLRDIRTVAFLRFADDLSPDAFERYLKEKNGQYSVRGLPADGDPNVQRVQAIRDRDYRLVDTLDQHYYLFGEQIQGPYDEWRAASYQEAKNLEKVRKEAIGRMVAGAVGVAAGIYGAGQASNGAEAAAAYSGVIGGGYLLKTGIDKFGEKKLHVEALKELGESLSSDLKPRVIELEGKTITLSGSAEAQYQEWRELLKKIYANETGLPPKGADDGSAADKDR
ncbi:hypothetical protein FHR99_001761 [Litorivivens lipolytica]|uniref:Lipoprotein n=1 Tax=Litorivivens lipolytica TaxID=1524264 RepID=A0A7W4Z6Z8_9GAMM|nr:hypothetical protein [Litorivivens lipolytica]MBB3047495.1 hypothetical protein [Litorivivens lipolytica]